LDRPGLDRPGLDLPGQDRHAHERQADRARRDHIAAAAERAFVRHGFHAATMQQVAGGRHERRQPLPLLPFQGDPGRGRLRARPARPRRRFPRPRPRRRRARHARGAPARSRRSARWPARAGFVVDHGPTAISRYDRTRRVTIEGDLAGDAALGDAVAAIRALPTAQHLPPGVEIRETGDVEVMGEVFASFAAAIGAGVTMVYALLALLFGSFLQPIAILVSLPLSFGGAIGALLLTHKAMSMPVAS
jgi:hypothetical protein